MAGLSNSQRRSYKATYVPTKPILDANGEPMVARGLYKLSFIRSLGILQPEIAQLKQDQALAGIRDVSGTGVTFLDIVESLTQSPGLSAMTQYGPMLARLPLAAFEALGSALVGIRRQRAAQIEGLFKQIADQFQTRRAPPLAEGPATQPRVMPVTQLAGRAPGTLPSPPGIPESSNTDVQVPQGSFYVAALHWAIAQKLPQVDELYALATSLMNLPAAYVGPMAAIPPLLSDSVASATVTSHLVDGFLDQFHVEPIGRLHLERLEMTPVGVEHGELVHSVPLAPNETINVSHKEWSVQSQDYADVVDDYLQGYSEQGVAEKQDLSHAIDTTTKHDTQMDISGGVTAKMDGTGYSITASAAADYKTQSDSQESVKDSRDHALSVTRKASTRTAKDHKHSFIVSSVVGTENASVEVLTNPSSTQSMRVDYFQLMRKWQVNLIRYGLRLTYDLIIPNPGADLVLQVSQLRAINDELASKFHFDLLPADITRANFMAQAAQYGASIDAPPDDPATPVYVHKIVPFIDKDPANTTLFDSIEFTTPDQYEISSVQLHYDAVPWPDTGGDRPLHFKILDTTVDLNIGAGSNIPEQTGDVTFDSLVGKSGSLSIIYELRNFSTVVFEGWVNLQLKESALEQWQLASWSTLNGAALQAYQARQQVLQDARAQLSASIAQWDALTLRMREREEIMKGVLRWLFGPTFELVPLEIANLFTPDPADPSQSVLNVDPSNPYAGGVLTNAQWERVMLFGELIKFLHQAIEWENVLYLPYPYFWDSPANWASKLFLTHPDPEHQTFLRAGCARVVLTITPGFEEAFTSLVETGSFDALPTGHPYVTIAQEIQNFANTNYPGIPPANPAENVRPLLFPEQRTAWNDLENIMTLLAGYYAAIEPGTSAPRNRYPTTADGLAALVATPDTPLPTVDPWGNAYVYQCPGTYGDYDLSCLGRDGAVGGTGLDADITSWAEGNLVGTWFEYTPTSALDISISTALPTTPVMA